jgi:GNAT superfamily N-acetyltransferase
MTPQPITVVVVPASENDVAALLRMIRHEAEYERLTEGFAATEQKLSQALFGPRPLAEAAIARVADQPVGFAVYFTTFSTFQAQAGIYLEDLFVEEPWRGKGIGRKLLAHVAGVAVVRGCPAIHWGVLKWNEPAIRFYHNIGAEQLDAWHHFHLTGDALRELAGSACGK